MTPTIPSPDGIVVLTNAGSRENAFGIARRLLEARLAACVNVIPGIRSFYRWKDELAEDEEHLLLIKTRRPLFDRVRQCILEVHTYELPEVISLPLDGGDAGYLDWLRRCTPGG